MCGGCETPWPLQAVTDSTIGDDERANIERLAAKLASSTPVSGAIAYASALASENVHPGWLTGPTLWVEDHRGIDLITDAAARDYEYRSLGLARTGDTLLLARSRDHVFEDYVCNTLGLGMPLVKQLEPGTDSRVRSLCAACLDDDEMLAALVSDARDAGGYSLVPYRSDGYAWELMRRIARDARVPVYVAAAVPPIARAANNKLWFAELARNLLGDDASPPSWAVHGSAVAAARLAALAVDHTRLVLKLPSSAGALGNVVIEADEIRNKSLGDIRTRIVDTLAVLGWSGTWPVLVGVWESTVLGSPSVQIWIPPGPCGEPVVEGVYEQRLVGEHGIFVGAREASIELPLLRRLESEALQLALLLQRIGYVGRASFDALIVGATANAARLHWIECNARWGGVSIPMSVLRRLGIAAGQRDTLIAQAPVDATTTTFSQVLTATATLGFDHDTGRGVVWLAPPETGRRSIDFVAVGTDALDSMALAAAVRGAVAAV